MASRGFTLIELIVVIVLLGALAAVALPRFQNLSSAAGVAAVEHLAGAVREAATQWRTVCAVKGPAACHLKTGVSTIQNNGQSVQMWNGWPDAGDHVGTNEIDMTVRATGFTVSISAGQNTFWRFTAARDPATCHVRYTESLTSGGSPAVTSDTSGC